MAQLIKTKTKPRKWLLKNKLEFVPVNHLLTNYNFNNTRKQIANIETISKKAKNAIKDFYLNKNHYFLVGIKRSTRRYNAQLALETIMLAITWRNNCRREAEAMVAIAHKIAVNVTNDPRLPQASSMVTKDMEEELKNSFLLHLCIPKERLESIATKYNRLVKFFGDSFLRAHHLDHGAQIYINDLCLDFDDSDIDGVLRTASRHCLDDPNFTYTNDRD